MYFNQNEKWNSFTYKNKSYPSGTNVVYSGKCYINECEIVLHNQIVTFLYTQYNKAFFNNGNTLLSCPSWEFSNKIVKIIEPNIKTTETAQQESVFYWTDDMVVKTIWYVIIMLAAVICYGRIFIWLIATIVWYNSVFQKKK